ncbi:hypothetical protein FGO68_gene192 [Halteria grandinella]|uniref:TRP C-terminal domain-containing protein n=1 Tax=Halteria grandinella TaxID=5974 RepID=A0A8J8T7Q3_HALGN|nr:hypothetical protein FGO68_gene192 [Halteria grandinella]
MLVFKADRFGVIKILFSGQFLIKDLIEQLKESDFSVKLATKGQKPLNFSIINRNGRSGMLEFQIEFDDPTTISSGNEFDIVEVSLNRELVVTSGLRRRILFGGGVQDTVKILKIESGLSRVKAVPAQLSEVEAQIVEEIEDTAELTSYFFVSSFLIFNIFMGILINHLWDLLSDLSFMMILSVISINVPGLVQIVQQILLNFIYMDLFQTDKWVIPIFYTEEELAQDEPMNIFFDLNGLGSPRFIVTTGSSFVFLIIFIFQHILYFFIKDVLSRFTRKGQILAEKLSAKLHWAGTVRFIMQQLAPLLLASALNLYKFEFNCLGDFINIQCSSFVLVSTPFIIIKFATVLHRAKSEGLLEDESFTSQYEDLIDGLNLQTTVGLYWNILIFIRWIITITIIILLRDDNSLQILTLLSLSIIFMALLQLGRPFPDLSDIRLATINELLISAYLYLLICLTDYNEKGAYRFELGLALLFLVVLCVAVNIMYVFGNLLAIGMRKLYLKILRCKAKHQVVQKGQIQKEEQDFPKNFLNLQKAQIKLETNLRQMIEQPNESSTNLLYNQSTMRQTQVNSSQIHDIEDNDYQNFEIPQKRKKELKKTMSMDEESFTPPSKMSIKRFQEAEATQNFDGKLKMLIEPTISSEVKLVGYRHAKKQLNRKPFI